MTEQNPTSAKERRASIALLFFIIAAHIAYLLPQTSQIAEVTQSYPATACPGSISDAKATALFPNKSVKIRDVARVKSELRKNNQGSYPINQGGQRGQYDNAPKSRWKMDFSSHMHHQ
jgi:hypothetical protein